jgi:hypothetical protein
LGLCLDTAQMALAPAYGFDPTTGDGYTSSDVSALRDRISKLDPSKIFFFEISDVQLPDPPLYSGSPYDEWAKSQPEGTPARSNWVLTARSIPYVGRKLGREAKSEKDMGAARVAEVARAVFATGFRGECVCTRVEILAHTQARLSGKCLKRPRWRSKTGRSRDSMPRRASGPGRSCLTSSRLERRPI